MNNASPERNYLKSLTLLYVEDEELTREIFSEFLSRLVGVLITAKNGAEGLDAYREHCPDIPVILPLNSAGFFVRSARSPSPVSGMR